MENKSVGQVNKFRFLGYHININKKYKYTNQTTLNSMELYKVMSILVLLYNIDMFVILSLYWLYNTLILHNIAKLSKNDPSCSYSN